ncbi:hypothetical protein DICVIV_14181, partial [Dictyocaulus viviparus]
MRLADQLDDVLRHKQLTAQLQQQQSWREFHSTDTPPTEEFVGSNLEEKRQINAFIWDSFEKTIEKREDGYYVRLPWKDNADTLPHNKGMAIRRLQATINKLKNDSTLLQQYEATIAQQLDQNIIEEVQETNTAEGPIVHYLAHHGVTTPNKETTQLRVVFDASAHQKNQPSLNEVLYQGPSFFASNWRYPPSFSDWTNSNNKR